MSQPFNVLGICGSLRKTSTNLKLLRAAIAAAPATLRILEHPIGDLPIFCNEDIEKLPDVSFWIENNRHVESNAPRLLRHEAAPASPHSENMPADQSALRSRL